MFSSDGVQLPVSTCCSAAAVVAGSLQSCYKISVTLPSYSRSQCISYVAKAKPAGFQVPDYAAQKSAAVMLTLFSAEGAVPVTIVVLCFRERVLRRSYLRSIREPAKKVLDSPETVCRLLEHNQ